MNFNKRNVNAFWIQRKFDENRLEQFISEISEKDNNFINMIMGAKKAYFKNLINDPVR